MQNFKVFSFRKTLKIKKPFSTLVKWKKFLKKLPPRWNVQSIFVNFNFFFFSSAKSFFYNSRQGKVMAREQKQQKSFELRRSLWTQTIENPVPIVWRGLSANFHLKLYRTISLRLIHCLYVFRKIHFIYFAVSECPFKRLFHSENTLKINL